MYVNTPVTVPPVAADEPTIPVTVAAAVIPPATTNAPSAPFNVPLVSLSTSLKKPSGSAEVPISTVGLVPPVDPPIVMKEIGIAPVGKTNVLPAVADVPILTAVAPDAVGSNEITYDKVTTLGVAFPFPAPPFDLTIPWNVVVAMLLSS